MKIPREQYQELSAGKSIPYTFEIKKDSQVLFYFGANHSRDPRDKQYPVLRKYWKKFLTQKDKKLVFVEGVLRNPRLTEKEAIQTGSEGSYITVLAARKKIPIICPEPSRKDIITLLRRKFTEDQILYYEFASLIDHWRRGKPKPEFMTWIKAVMAQESAKLNAKNLTLEHMTKIHRRIFKKAFNHRQPKFFNHIINPNRTDSIINQVARMSSDIRERVIIKQIKKEWDSGHSLFVVYGSGHAFIQEPILRKLLT